MKLLALSALILGLVACTESTSSDTTSPDTSAEAPDSGESADDSGAAAADNGPTTADSGTTLPDSGTDIEATGCSADNLAACAYIPERPQSAAAPTLGPFEITYTDATDGERTFGYEVRIPEGADTTTPILVWSHGGSSGKTNPNNVASNLGKIAVEAGYIMVAIAHYPRPFDTYEDLCKSIGQTQAQCKGGACSADSECTAFDQGTCGGGQCRYFKPLNWDRPNDVKALLDSITAPESPLGTQGDLSKIVYAGHSAGAGSALMLAGAVRQYGDTTALLYDKRPIAFMSGSPQAKTEAGFIDTSYTGEGCLELADAAEYCLTRPHLILTGAGDDTSGTVAEDRRDAYNLLPGTDKHLIWITEEAARHTTFELKPDSCEDYTGPDAVDSARCQTYVDWLQSAAIAFLDAYTRDDALAKQYLASDNLITLAGGSVEWESK